MLFDKMCAVAERFIPEIVPVMQGCALFALPGTAQEAHPDIVATRKLADLAANFKLPKMLLTVERPGTCLVLVDDVNRPTGFSSRRFYAECSVVTEATLKSMRRNPNAPLPSTDDVLLVRAGSLDGYRPSDDGSPGRVLGSLAWWALFTKNEVVVKPQFLPSDPSKYDDYDNVTFAAALDSLRIGVEELMYFASVENMVEKVRVTTLKATKNRIARSPDRPLFTFVSPAILGGTDWSSRQGYRYILHQKV